MEKLIQCLQIFLKYGNPSYPTHCEHDVLQVCISPNIVSDDDKKELKKLGGFVECNDYDCFQSFRFGSA